MVMQVRDQSTGQLVTLPLHPVRGHEWYGAAAKRGVHKARGLPLQRNAKNLSGQSIQKLMRAYWDAERGTPGADLTPSQERLGEMAGLSKETARRAQQWLVENGWLLIAGRFKVNKHGWKMFLTIPDEDYDPATFEWGNIHPEREVEWLATKEEWYEPIREGEKRWFPLEYK